MSGTIGEQDPINSRVMHPARRYNYLLGGKDNFVADRRSGDALIAANPSVRIAVRENRKFMHRVVAQLASRHRIDQFLDIGTGIPTSPNTHEIAQAINPAARIVYVDNDPMVLTHARALLTSGPQGKTSYIEADLRNPQTILTGARDTLDLTRPVALMILAVLHFLDDDDVIRASLQQLVGALPPGSFLALSHGTRDHLDPQDRATLEKVLQDTVNHGTTRSRSDSELADLIDSLGLRLLDPGIVSVVDWHPDPEAVEPRATPQQALCWAAVARRP